MTKQEKDAQATAMNAAGRRAKIEFVVMVVADRNRAKNWKWVCSEAGRLCDATAGAVSKMYNGPVELQHRTSILAFRERRPARRLDRHEKAN